MNENLHRASFFSVIVQTPKGISSDCTPFHFSAEVFEINVSRTKFVSLGPKLCMLIFNFDKGHKRSEIK